MLVTVCSYEKNYLNGPDGEKGGGGYDVTWVEEFEIAIDPVMVEQVHPVEMYKHVSGDTVESSFDGDEFCMLRLKTGRELYVKGSLKSFDEIFFAPKKGCCK